MRQPVKHTPLRVILTSVALMATFFAACDKSDPRDEADSRDEAVPRGGRVAIAANQSRVLRGGLTIDYPWDGTLFPPEIAAPTFLWQDAHLEVDRWMVTIEFSDGQSPMSFFVDAARWTPPDQQWETIKRRSLEKTAVVVIEGVDPDTPNEMLSGASISISTSADEVGAPLFYREVILPFIDAVKDPSRIRWRFGSIESKEQPPVVLEQLPVCGNCHSFSADGTTLAMDVDYANSKGSYVIRRIAEEMILHTSDMITWDDYRRGEGKPSFGLLSQISPDGRYVVSTVKDRSVFVPRPELAFSQLFFPIQGILVVYDRKTRTFRALPGADDEQFVQSNPTWSPDGKYLVFARSKVHHLKQVRDVKSVLLSEEECREFLENREDFRFDLYRIPFNDGRGGRPEPLAGASCNGKSNFFPKYSPDGKWIVFCRARSFMLLQPDSELWIIPADGGEARRLDCNTSRMNSWHSWSPNGKWLVFSSKVRSPYTQLFLTHIDESGHSTPPVVLDRFTGSDRAANIPEFVNAAPGAIKKIHEQFVDDFSHLRAGHQLLLEGDHDLAVRAYGRALQLNPNNAEAHATLGATLSAHGLHDRAKTHLRRAIELNPDDLHAHCNLGLELIRSRAFQEAAAQFREALRIHPEFAKAHYNLGRLLRQLGKPDEAEHHLAEAARLLPDDFVARHELGVALRQLGKIPEALAELRASLAQNPDYAPAHFELGQILINHRQPEQAKMHFAAALHNAPALWAPLNDLAWAYATHPNPRARNGSLALILAECVAESAQEKTPAILDTLAAAYAETGQFNRAVETASKAMVLARQTGDAALADRIGTRLELYRSGKPFHQPDS